MEITFGAMAPPLTEQLDGVFHAEKLLFLEKDNKAITRLHVRGLLTDAQVLSARKKLVRRIEAEAKKKG